MQCINDNDLLVSDAHDGYNVRNNDSGSGSGSGSTTVITSPLKNYYNELVKKKIQH